MWLNIRSSTWSSSYDKWRLREAQSLDQIRNGACRRIAGSLKPQLPHCTLPATLTSLVYLADQPLVDFSSKTEIQSILPASVRDRTLITIFSYRFCHLYVFKRLDSASYQLVFSFKTRSKDRRATGTQFAE